MDCTSAFQIGLRAAVWWLSFCQLPSVQQVWLETLRCKKSSFFSVTSVSSVLQYSDHTDEVPEALHLRNANWNHLNLKCHLWICFLTVAEILGAVRPPDTDWYSWPKCPGHPLTRGHLYGCREALWARLQWNKSVLGLFPGSKCYGRHLTTLRSRAGILIKNLWAFHPKRVQTLHYQYFTNSISAGG